MKYMKILSKILGKIFDPISTISLFNTKKTNDFFKKHPFFIYLFTLIIVILLMAVYYLLLK